MTSLYKLAIFAIILCCNFCSLASENFLIKVLLDKFDTTKQTIFNISAKKEIIITSPTTSNKKYLLKNPKLQLLIKNNELYGRTRGGPFRRAKTTFLRLYSNANAITINKTTYYGSLSLTFLPKEKKLLLLNTLELEDYVYSVLSAESYQTWPNEMQKVQAIASRAYAIHCILERKRLSKKKTRYYDIKCSTFHQRYPGSHTFTHLRKAVDETKGLILTHNNNVALTMFDACCGGSVPAHIKGIDFKKAPYLARKTPCHYCKKYALYKWRRIIPTKRFLSYVEKDNKFDPDASIKIEERDKAGAVHKIKISHRDCKDVIISGKDLWMSMPSIIRSQNFSLEQRKNSIVINGRGFGHQIGLCQRGARELVKRGWSAKKILAFYYPGTTISRLQRKNNPVSNFKKKKKEKKHAVIQRAPRRGCSYVCTCTTTDTTLPDNLHDNLPNNLHDNLQPHSITKTPTSRSNSLSPRLTFSRHRHSEYGAKNILYDSFDAHFCLNRYQTMGSIISNYSNGTTTFSR